MKKHMLAKRMGAIALCAVLSTGLLSATAAAQGKDVTAYLSPDLSIVVDGSYRTFYNAVGQEVHPILYGGTTHPGHWGADGEKCELEPVHADGFSGGRPAQWLSDGNPGFCSQGTDGSGCHPAGHYHSGGQCPSDLR